MIDLAVFDEQLREPFADSLIEGERIERIGPLVCVLGAAGGGSSATAISPGSTEPSSMR